MNLKLLKANALIIIIIAIASALRLFSLSTIPIGFNDDEAAFGYNAYSISKTLHDESGKLLPFPVFESFGDWKLSGYLYITVISQKVFGPNEFATRLPSALFGIVAVYSTYLLGKKLFEKKIGLLAMFLLAISPWHIVASRNAFESDILIAFITTGTYLFLEAQNNKKLLPFSFICFISTFYIYRSAWVFTPLFVVFLIYNQRQNLSKLKTSLKVYIIATFLIILPIIFTVITFRGQSRFFQESFIYGVQRTGIINEVNDKRGACLENTNRFVCNVIYNKYSSFITVYFNNYAENLSPETYFTKGVANGYQALANRGLFYSFELPLLLIGIASLLRAKNSPSQILFVWIILVPLGASITSVGNPGRLNILLPAPQIIEAAGFFYLLSLIKNQRAKNLSILGSTFVMSFVFIKLLADMFFYYPKISATYQRYGYKELFTYLESQRQNYNQVAVSRRTDDAKQYIHYLFYNKIDPNQYRATLVSHKDENGWQVVERINNINFYGSAPPLESLPKKSLLALGVLDGTYATKPIYTVFYPNGDTFFRVYDVDQLKLEQKQK